MTLNGQFIALIVVTLAILITGALVILNALKEAREINKTFDPLLKE